MTPILCPCTICGKEIDTLTRYKIPNPNNRRPDLVFACSRHLEK